MKETRRLIKNTGIIAVGGMATKLVQFLLLPLYTALLSTAEYGTVDYLNTIALFCVPVASLLMDEALFRFLIDCKTDEDRSRTVTASCALLCIGGVAFLVCVLIVGAIFGSDNIGWIIGLVLSGSALQMVSALLRGFGDTLSYATANFTASLLTILLNVAFIAFFQWGVVGMLSATIIAQAGVAIVFAFTRHVWKYIDVSAVNVKELTRLLRYSIPLIPNKVSWTIMNMSSRLVIMNVLGASSAGLFAIAYKFPNVMDQIYGFFYMSWKESSARALNSNEDEVSFYNRIYRALRRFMMSVVFGMTALMPIVFEVLIDSSYHEGILYVPVLLLATYFSNISGFYGGIFTAYKDTKIMGTTTILSATICLALNIALIPLVGLYGASAATLIATFCVNEYRRRRVAEYARLEEDPRELFGTILSGAIVFSCFYLYMYSNSIYAFAIGFVTALVFALASNRDALKRLATIVRRA